MDWLLSTANQGPVFQDLRAVRDYLRLWLGPQGFESFGALFLDAQHRLICCRELFRGTLAAADVYPREVAKAALELNAGAVVLFHNRPSGTPEPSEADVRLTGCLRDMLHRLDVRVLDHLVIGSRGSVSFAERRLM
jgi:DNA repair protein RadC